MKFKKGEKVLVEGEVIEGRGWDLYDVSFGDSEDDTLTVGPKGIYSISETINNCDYNKGANDAWELARKIVLPESDGGYSDTKIQKIFGDYSRSYQILKHKSFEEASNWVERWEEERIHVGDLVHLSPFDKGVVTGVDDDTDTCYLVWSNGVCERADSSVLTKIGKLDSTQEFLKQIKEGGDA